MNGPRPIAPESEDERGTLAVEQRAFSAFRRLYDDFGFQSFVIACSGGSDSLSLLHLAKCWSDQNAPDISLAAVTVDHGLRPESADEAAFVAGEAEALGIPHRTIQWSGSKPETGLQEAARSARYDLLDGAASELRCDAVLTGHTADDQAETLLMRLRQGSGPRGLAGMALVRDLPFSAIARPLLCTRRGDLRAWLIGRGADWIDDPSNQDQSYERVRTRAWLNESHCPNIIEQLGTAVKEFGRLRTGQDKAALNWLNAHGVAHDAGWMTLDRQVFLRLPTPEQREVLRWAAYIVGAREFSPSDEKLLRLAEAIGAGESVSLGSVHWQSDGEQVLAFREARNLPKDKTVKAGVQLWDDRFVLTLAMPDAGDELKLGALGEEGWSQIISDQPSVKDRKDLRYLAAKTLPCIFDRFGVCEVPLLGYTRPNSRPIGAQPVIQDCRWIGRKALASRGFVVA